MKLPFWLLVLLFHHARTGAWNLEGAAELHWSDGDRWSATVELPAGRVVEYKYVVLDGSGNYASAWQVPTIPEAAHDELRSTAHASRTPSISMQLAPGTMSGQGLRCLDELLPCREHSSMNLCIQ